MTASQLSVACRGCGNMGRAILRGLHAAGALNRDDSFTVDIAACPPFEDIKAHVIGAEPAPGTFGVDIELLCLKPGVYRAERKSIAPPAGSQALRVSVMAGVGLSELGSGPCVRVMPNMPAACGQGCGGWIWNGVGDSGKVRAQMEVLCAAMGPAFVEVSDESLLHAVTGLSGSGPAYAFMFMEALSDAGVREGLPRDVADKLAKQMVAGSAGLAISSGDHLAKLRNTVESPGGTTIYGSTALETGGLRKAVQDAVHAAATRSRELA